MVSRLVCLSLVIVAAIAVWHIDSNTAMGQSPIAASGYYNYYSPSHDCASARLYPCPRPVPARVGYTYITYQPLAPHEFLYKHKRIYLRRNTNGRITRTSVWWQ